MVCLYVGYLVFVIWYDRQKDTVGKMGPKKSIDDYQRDSYHPLEMSPSPAKRKSSYTPHDATSIIKEDSILEEDLHWARKGAFKEIIVKIRKRTIKEFKNLDWFQKIFYIIELPLHILVQLTIPPVSTPLYNKWQRFIYPFTTPLFILLYNGWMRKPLFSIGTFNIELWMGALFLGCLLSGLIFTARLNSLKCTPRWLFLPLTVLGSLAWIDLLVRLIIAVLALVKVLTGWKDMIMGTTILAIGNSFPDLFLCTALAAQGHSIMGVTGIFAGSLFNFLLGMGLSFFVQAGQPNLPKSQTKPGSTPGQTFSLFTFSPSTRTSDWLTALILLASFSSLSLTYFRAKWNHHQLSASFAWIQLGLYIALCVGLLMLIYFLDETK